MLPGFKKVLRVNCKSQLINNGMDFSSRNPATSNALNLAARNNDIANVKRLLQKINPNCVDNRGWTCLHEAAYNDSYESMLLILKSSRCRPLAETHEGHTALYLACRNKSSLETIQALLDTVDDIANYGSTEGVTPLHIASSQGRVDLIELLLQYGAIIDVQDFDGDTPMHEAVLESQHEAMLTLLYTGANPDIMNETGGFTPFHLACCKGYYPNVEELLPFIDDINQLTASGDSPLSLALQGLNDEIVYFLLKNGADPHLKNVVGDMAIDIAITVGSSAAVFKTLLTETKKEKLNKNIILKACKPHYFKFEILEILLNSDLGPEFFSYYEPFDKFLNLTEDIIPIFHTNAPLNAFLNICGYIHNKSPEKFKEFFYLVLMRGVSVNASDVNECPPIVYAVYVNTTCFEEVFKILIEHGCNVDYCSSMMCLDKDCCIPDAFLTSLTTSPSAPIMMPYSLNCEPEKFLRLAYDGGQLNIIPQQVQYQLLTMIDPAFQSITAESLQYSVPCLKHLCRHKVRSVLSNREGGVKSTQDFLQVINSIPVPPIIKNYLRYL